MHELFLRPFGFFVVDNLVRIEKNVKDPGETATTMYCLCNDGRGLFLNHNDNARHLQYYCNNIIAVHTYCLNKC